MFEKKIDTKAIAQWFTAAGNLLHETEELENEIAIAIQKCDGAKIDDTARKLRGLYSMITENYNLMCDYTRCH